MARTIEEPRTITYKGRSLTVSVKSSSGLYAGEPDYKFVEAVVAESESEATGKCGANFYPLTLATWLACRRAVRAAETGPTESKFDWILNRLSET